MLGSLQNKSLRLARPAHRFFSGSNSRVTSLRDIQTFMEVLMNLRTFWAAIILALLVAVIGTGLNAPREWVFACIGGILAMLITVLFTYQEGTPFLQWLKKAETWWAGFWAVVGVALVLALSFATVHAAGKLAGGDTIIKHIKVVQR
jgi:hypothetical protein